MAAYNASPVTFGFSGRRLAWLLATPMIAGIIVFAVYPFIYLLLLSLSDS